MRRRPYVFLLLVSLACAACGDSGAEDGSQAWLRYAPPPDPPRYHDMPHAVVRLGDAPEELSAADELDRGLGHMIAGTDVLTQRFSPALDSIVLGTTDAIHRARLSKQIHGFREKPLPPEGFRIVHVRNGMRQWWVLQGGSPRAELYAAFRFMALVAQDQTLPDELIDAPTAPIRWVDQWDNVDGSVERGYAGPSIFFQDGHVRTDLHRVIDYARLLASVGINGVAINPHTDDPRTLSPSRIAEIARIADAMRPWGVRVSLPAPLSSPGVVGGLPTSDPQDPTVIAWWQREIEAIYSAIPDFAGFTLTVGAREGSLPHGRTLPDAVDAIARPLQKHGGFVLLRTSVADADFDVRTPQTDPARAAYDRFHADDGKFLPNVVLQIGHGPIDSQTREPVSPLIAALRHTPQAMELQISQEYTGQQRHMVDLLPLWKTVFDTDLRVDNQQSFARDIASGKTFRQPLGGFVGVANVGMESNWLHHPMALVNLYGFGRLAWNPAMSAASILDEWTRMTWSNDERVYGPIEAMQSQSWRVYEQYTGPLGMGSLSGRVGAHFGPWPQSSANEGEGPWMRATPTRIGTDRTVATGTGYIGQYPPELAATYESLATCPDELLLFLHRVPYTHPLLGNNDPADKGKTVLQHLYDVHYAGAAAAAGFVDTWEAVKGLVDEDRYAQVHRLLVFQAGHAEVWRDAIDDWLQRTSGIRDTLGYVGRHPGRVEAEAMQGSGFRTVDVDPWESASGGKAAVCGSAACSLRTTFTGEPNAYRIQVGYFDLHPGEAKYRLLVNGAEVAHFSANDTLPPDRPDDRLNGNTATRFIANGVHLKPGDTVTLEATPDGKDPAAIDFLEITRDPRWN